MQILELETRSGLDRATIRHYEKEGLISPIRQSNGYRDYSDADLQHLQKIKLLRQLGMSLEKIRHLQQGSEVFASALSEQLQTLDTCMVTYQRARAICQEMLDNHTSYESMDAESYYQDKCREIADVREFTSQALKNLGFTVLDSKSNFLFAKTDAISGEVLYLELKKRGILVRHFGAERICEFNRITIGTAEQMKIFIETVKDILSGGNYENS